MVCASIKKKLEFDSVASITRRSEGFRSMTTVVTDFVELLGQTELLSPVQVHELSTWLPRFEELSALTKELLNRGWLTSYQVSRLNEGSYEQLLMGPYVLLEELGQ